MTADFGLGTLAVGPIELVVVQPTPFCNIDCDYCYLSNRSLARRMRRETLEATLRAILTSGILAKNVTIVWHAGEPLLADTDFYEEAFELTQSLKPSVANVQHAIQTNGTLLSQRWIDLFARNNVSVGISLDGPEWLHDMHRKRRNGRGTHAEVMRAVQLLQDSSMPFAVIAVLTAQTLSVPDEFFNFFDVHSIVSIGLNVEEVEGANHTSTMSAPGIEVSYRRFLQRLMERNLGRPQMRFREFTHSEALLRGERPPSLTQIVPFRAVNVDYEGNFSTFSPEMLDATHPRYTNFLLGNFNTGSLREAFDSPKLRRLHLDIETGRSQCRQSCAYFGVCGGGTPANKAFELGTLAGTETMHCRLTQKVVHDVVATSLLARLN